MSTKFVLPNDIREFYPKDSFFYAESIFFPMPIKWLNIYSNMYKLIYSYPARNKIGSNN